MDITLSGENHDLGSDWRRVFAQTRRDETGVMTLPLTGHGFDPVLSVLETHPEAARAIEAQMAAEEGDDIDRTSAELQRWMEDQPKCAPGCNCDRDR